MRKFLGHLEIKSSGLDLCEASPGVCILRPAKQNCAARMKLFLWWHQKCHCLSKHMCRNNFRTNNKSQWNPSIDQFWLMNTWKTDRSYLKEGDEKCKCGSRSNPVIFFRLDSARGCSPQFYTISLVIPHHVPIAAEWQTLFPIMTSCSIDIWRSSWINYVISITITLLLFQLHYNCSVLNILSIL